MSTSGSLRRRLEKLEAMQPDASQGMPFLWIQEQTLDEALAFAKLSLDDGPVMAIRLVGFGSGWEISEEDQARLDEAATRPDRHKRGRR